MRSATQPITVCALCDWPFWHVVCSLRRLQGGVTVTHYHAQDGSGLVAVFCAGEVLHRTTTRRVRHRKNS